MVISRLHEARAEGVAKAKALLLALAASFAFALLAFFVPVLAYVPVALAVGLPAAQAAGFFLYVSPAIIGA